MTERFRWFHNMERGLDFFGLGVIANRCGFAVRLSGPRLDESDITFSWTRRVMVCGVTFNDWKYHFRVMDDHFTEEEFVGGELLAA